MQSPIEQNLPEVRGTYEFSKSLKEYTTFKIGGPAEVLYIPADVDDLAHFWANKPKDVPITLLGEGSNILIRDGGIAGIVVHLGKGMDAVEITDDVLFCEAGASTGKVARLARTSELTGAEFICGIPGSMGGALVMNAGCYGSEMVDILIDVYVITDTGEKKVLEPSFFNFVYRNSTLPEGWIYTGCTMQLKAGDKNEIREKMRFVNHRRRGSQPLEWPNAGSWFKNPEGPNGPMAAWKLIQESGCRGLRKGDAQVSEKHCNFFINLGAATAADMEDLGVEVQEKVLSQTGIALQGEVRLLGDRVQRF